MTDTDADDETQADRLARAAGRIGNVRLHYKEGNDADAHLEALRAAHALIDFVQEGFDD